jgi:hypothetical protein
MARTLLTQPDHTFQPLRGRYPVSVLGQDPSGSFVAMQVIGQERAAVWSTKNHQLAWAPANTVAICWLPDGNHVLLAREHYRPDVHKRDIVVTPLQSEFSHFFELRNWPAKKLLGRCGINLPRGWIVDLLASPTGALGCCVWNDQHEAGVELFAITDKEVRQLDGRGYHGRRSNLLVGPVFSADGCYLVLTYGNYAWWSPDDPETPCLGGICAVGWVVVGDLSVGAYRVTEIHKTTPRGWLPPDDPNDFRHVLLSLPVFIDAHHFIIRLPTGEDRTFSTQK